MDTFLQALAWLASPVGMLQGQVATVGTQIEQGAFTPGPGSSGGGPVNYSSALIVLGAIFLFAFVFYVGANVAKKVV